MRKSLQRERGLEDEELLARSAARPREAPQMVSPRPHEDPYRTIFDRHPHPTWVLDRVSLRILAANAAARTWLGYTAEAFHGMTYLDLLSPLDVTSATMKLGQFASSRGFARWRLRTKANTLLGGEVIWRPVPFEGAPGILVIAEPLHPGLRQLLQEAEEGRTLLEGLSRRLVDVQETERAQIAREIHDEIGQLLTGLKLMLSTGGSNALSETKEEMLGIVDELVGRLRNLSMDLRPPMLDEIGLLAALSWHFERYTTRTDIRVSFRHHSLGSVRFPPAVEIAAFRIIQEALTNVARHASTDTAEVEVTVDSRFLRARIEDSGVGFDRAGATAGGSAGITGMRERAHLLGGTFSIDSAPGAGTRVSVELPAWAGGEAGTWRLRE